MKKYNLLSSVMIGLSVALLCPIVAFANSSWRWISETRPYDILPIVILMTLVIEILSVCLICKIKAVGKVFVFISLANILSFLAPYLLLHVIPSLYTIEQNLEHMPFYTIGFSYLLATIAIELPVVYFALKNSTEKTKRLLFTIIGANVVTTVLTAVIERTICKGIW